MLYGYQRVSTQDQSLSRQTQELVDYGVAPENIYTDKESGGNAHRRGLDTLLGKLERGDTVVVLSFDRLARSTYQLLQLSEDFSERGIELVSIHDKIDTSTPGGKLYFTISAAFAEFEKAMNNERTREGLEAARRRGVKLGRPRVPSEVLDDAMSLYATSDMSVSKIAELVGTSPSSIHREARRRGLRRRRG